MITLSLCMIVRDEEAVLSRCLDSVRGIADEIILVDTGSRDRTKEIAARYTERVYDFPWQNDFSAPQEVDLVMLRYDMGGAGGTPFLLFFSGTDLAEPGRLPL